MLHMFYGFLLRNTDLLAGKQFRGVKLYGAL